MKHVMENSGNICIVIFTFYHTSHESPVTTRIVLKIPRLDMLIHHKLAWFVNMTQKIRAQRENYST